MVNGAFRSSPRQPCAGVFLTVLTSDFMPTGISTRFGSVAS